MTKETMNPSAHSVASTNDDPGDLFKSAANLVVRIAIVTAVVIALIIWLAVMASGVSVSVSDSDMSDRAVEARIQKVGTLALADAVGSGPRSGEDLYKAGCATCHTAGLLGAPKLADKTSWGPRIASGYAALLNSALKGKNAMPAKGGADYSDVEVGRALVFMANSAGASFSEPESAKAVPAPVANNAKP